MDLEGRFWIREGHFCIVCQKVRELWPLWPLVSDVPGKFKLNLITNQLILRPFDYMVGQWAWAFSVGQPYGQLDEAFIIYYVNPSATG